MALTFICVGIVLRLYQYLCNRSLCLDESALALNIVNRSFSDLLQPLDYHQVAPIGFLFVVKSLVQFFGNNEYVLRLLPFFAGILSIFLFYRVAKQAINTAAVPIALGLFAFSTHLIYYSSEVKQYSTDVAIALLIYSLMADIHDSPLTSLRMILLGVVGAVSVWLSHPSVFILAATGGTLALLRIERRAWSSIRKLSGVYLVWLLSFAIFFLVSFHGSQNNVELEEYWSTSFMPFPPLSLTDLRWFDRKFFSAFEDPLGLPLVGLASLAFLVGCMSLFARSKHWFFYLLSPVLITLIASGFEIYPFSGRLLLFTVPSILLIISEGAQYIRDKTRLNAPAVGIILIGLLFFYPVLTAASHLKRNTPIKARQIEDIKPVLDYVGERKKYGDVMYLYYAAEYAFKYYAARYGLGNDEYVVGICSRKNWRKYIEDMDRLRGNRRVWLLFSHMHSRSGVDERKFFLFHLDSFGRRLEYVTSDGVAAYLYDLSGSAPNSN